jgi:hypothetical protein
VQQWLRLYGKEHRIVVIPLGGDQLINRLREVELGELARLSRNVSVLFDSERPAPEAAPLAGREDFAKICEKLGFSVCMTDRRALENYLSDRAIKDEMGEKYSALPNFVRLEDHKPCWRKTESWRIARRMREDEIVGTDVGRFLQAL